MARTQQSKRGPSWDSLELAPLILIRSKEPVLAERACERLRSLALEGDPETDIVRLDAATAQAGALEAATSPSLFSASKFVQIEHLEQLSAEFAQSMESYVANPAPDVTVVAIHGGGNRGAGLLKKIAAAGHSVCTIDEVKYDKEKAALLEAEARAAGRTLTRDGAAALVDALGSDLREMLGALAQLLSDTDGTIDGAAVHEYYAGRKEANGFDVADAAIAGNAGAAIALLRHALATGTDPVPIVAALAMKLRAMALVLGARTPGRSLSLAPWQVDRAKRELSGWSGEGLAVAIAAVASADEAVKGGSRTPEYAVERAVIEVVRARRIRA